MPATGMHGRGVAEPSGTVVFVNLVGGADGLSLLVPHSDPEYLRRRPGLAVAAPGERYGAIDLGRGLGLHPAMAPVYNAVGGSERLAMIGGVGVPDGEGGESMHLPSRDFLHRGGRHEREGWATRLLRFEGMDASATWSFGAGPHPMFEGLPDHAALTPPVKIGARHVVAGDVAAEAVTGTVGPPSATRSATSRWSDDQWESPAERLSRGYPEGRLGRALASTADMLRHDAGLRIVAIEQLGYDTHVDQGDGRAGVLAHKLDRLGRSLAAFWADVVSTRSSSLDADPVTVVVVSEFGRAIDENDSGGTEHGRGGVALVFGDRVVGGVHGDLPSVEHDDVWPVTIDVRRVLADAVATHGFRPWRSGVFARLALPNRSLGLLLSP